MSLTRSRLAQSLALAALATLLATQGALAAEVFASPAEVQPRLIGSDVPSAMVQRLDGSDADLRELVGKKRVVLIFYRGGW